MEYSNADEEGGADALDGEGVHASSSYHAKALNETVHNFMLLTIIIFQVAMYGFLKMDPNGNERILDPGNEHNFDYARAMLIPFFVSLVAYIRRLCALRKTHMDASVPGAVLSDAAEMPQKPSAFGYYVDADAFHERSATLHRRRLTSGSVDGFTFS